MAGAVKKFLEDSGSSTIPENDVLSETLEIKKKKTRSNNPNKKNSLLQYLQFFEQ